MTSVRVSVCATAGAAAAGGHWVAPTVKVIEVTEEHLCNEVNGWKEAC